MQFLLAPIANRLSPRNRLWVFLYRQLDAAFRLFENRRLQVHYPHLAWIPPAGMRMTGNTTISVYAYDMGFIGALIGEYVSTQDPNVLDLGCGPGKGVGAAWNCLGESGHYYGLDINQRFIDFDQSWYPSDRCSFIHASLFNSYYNPSGASMADYHIPLDDGSIDLVLALSLFTHLDKVDTRHYVRDLARLMKPGAIGLLTFFVLDESYDPARYQGTRWAFDRTLPDQPGWTSSSTFKKAEAQIGVARKDLDELFAADFELVKIVPGNWCGRPTSFLQDVVIVRRK